MAATKRDSHAQLSAGVNFQTSFDIFDTFRLLTWQKIW